MDKDKIINSVKYLSAMIITGVLENDRDCISSHLEDLNCVLAENDLLSRWIHESNSQLLQDKTYRVLPMWIQQSDIYYKREPADIPEYRNIG